jgi:hypothetical protein
MFQFRAKQITNYLNLKQKNKQKINTILNILKSLSKLVKVIMEKS